VGRHLKVPIWFVVRATCVVFAAAKEVPSVALPVLMQWSRNTTLALAAIAATVIVMDAVKDLVPMKPVTDNVTLVIYVPFAALKILNAAPTLTRPLSMAALWWKFLTKRSLGRKRKAHVASNQKKSTTSSK